MKLLWKLLIILNLIFYKSINDFEGALGVYNHYIKKAETIDKGQEPNSDSYCFEIVKSIMVSSYYQMDREMGKFIYNGSIKYNLVKAGSEEEMKLKALVKEFSNCYNAETLREGSKTEYDEAKLRMYLNSHLILNFLLDI